MKALFIGAGRRIEIAKKFLNKKWEIDAYEYDVNSPLKMLGIKIIEGKKWTDPEIKNDLSSLCKEYDLVLPFQDEATELLSVIKKTNHLNSICVSEQTTSNYCLDKKNFETLFANEKFYPNPIFGKTAVVKPTRGFGSRGIKYIQNWSGEQYDGCIIQNKIENGDEYSVDCYFDKSSKLIDFVPRKRIQVSGGEVVRSSTLEKTSFNFEEIISIISNKLHFSGPVCIQFISDENKNIWIMEINARFGGGCTLSIHSGFDIIDLLKTEYYDRKEINYTSTWKSNLYMTRSFLDFYYEKNSI